MIQETEMIFGLRSEWAILLAIFILTSVQLVKVILDSTKTKREKYERAKRIHTMDKIEMYLKILSNKYTEEVTERQLPVILREFMGHCQNTITITATSTISKNDVVNREKEISAKMHQVITNQFHSLQVNLGLFKWKGRLISEFIQHSWCDTLKSGVTDIVIVTTRRDQDEAHRQLRIFMNQTFEHFITETISTAYEL